MQLYVNVRPDLPDGGPYANMNPGDGKPFGVITFGDNAYVSVKTDDEARRVIAAAAALIKMREMLGTPHEFRRRGAASVVNFSHCARCGMLEDSPDHAGQDAGDEAPARVRAEPEPEAKCRACENEPATEGEFCEACAPAALLAASIADGTPVLVTGDEGHSSRHPDEDRQYREAMATLSAGGHTSKGLRAMLDAGQDAAGEPPNSARCSRPGCGHPMNEHHDYRVADKAGCEECACPQWTDAFASVTE